MSHHKLQIVCVCVLGGGGGGRKFFFLHCIDLIGEIDVYLTGYAFFHDKPFGLVNTHIQMFIYGPTSWLIEMETQKIQSRLSYSY